MKIVRGNQLIGRKIALLLQSKFRLPNYGDYVYDYSINCIVWSEGETGRSIWLNIAGVRVVGKRDYSGDKQVLVGNPNGIHYERYTEVSHLKVVTEIGNQKLVELVREVSADVSYPITYGSISGSSKRKPHVDMKSSLPSLFDAPRFIEVYSFALPLIEHQYLKSVLPLSAI